MLRLLALGLLNVFKLARLLLRRLRLGVTCDLSLMLLALLQELLLNLLQLRPSLLKFRLRLWRCVVSRRVHALLLRMLLLRLLLGELLCILLRLLFHPLLHLPLHLLLDLLLDLLLHLLRGLLSQLLLRLLLLLLLRCKV